MDRDIEGEPTADYLWNEKRGRAVFESGQGPGRGEPRRPVDEPMPELAALLDKAKAKRVSEPDALVHQQANGAGIKDIVTQQFEAARRIMPRVSCRSSSQRWISTAPTRQGRRAAQSGHPRRSFADCGRVSW